MHVLVAVPGKYYLDNLSPLLSALGEKVISVGADAAAASSLANGSMALDTFQKAMKGQSRPAVFSTINAPWPVFDTLLEAAARQALIIYEPAGLAIARRLEAGATVPQASEAWLKEAGSLSDFVQTHSQHVTLVRVDEALDSPRALLGACADRFRFNWVDETAIPASVSLPGMAYRLVGEAAVMRSPMLGELDARLSGQALVLEQRAERRLDELDSFLVAYRSLLDDQHRLDQMLPETKALREANRLAEHAAQALRLQLAERDAELQAISPSMGLGAASEGALRQYIAVLEAEKDQLRGILNDVQTIAETQASEASTLRSQLQENRRSLLGLKVEVDRAKAQLAARAAAPATPGKAGAPGQDRAAPRPSALRSLAGRLRPGRWLQARRDIELVSRSEYFDAAWYTAHNADVQATGADPAKHFVRHGGQEGRAPGPAFSSRRYLDENPDIARAGLNPLVHYLRFGKAEGRKAHRAE
ncbi:MAG: hypothetical protein R3B98_02600 [Hyphomonas sp.]